MERTSRNFVSVSTLLGLTWIFGFLPSVLNVGHVFAMNFSWKRRNVGGGGIDSNFSLEFETMLDMTI